MNPTIRQILPWKFSRLTVRILGLVFVVHTVFIILVLSNLKSLRNTRSIDGVELMFNGRTVENFTDTVGSAVSDGSLQECRVLPHHYFPVCKIKFEVERFCPVLPHRQKKIRRKVFDMIGSNDIRLNPERLLHEMARPELRWLRDRIQNTWTYWKVAGLKLKRQRYVKERKKKKVVFFLGSMALQPWFLTFAGHGGPLGELVQWTDVITATYLLGHEIKVVIDTSNINTLFQQKRLEQCIPKDYGPPKVDVIFTDINGNRLMIDTLGSPSVSIYRCTMRLLDSFGTQAEFNNLEYVGKIPGGRSKWGNEMFVLQQFMTLFLGKQDDRPVKKRDMALIYGKIDRYLTGLHEYLNVVHEHFEIHATMASLETEIPTHLSSNEISENQAFRYGERKFIPDYVINHGPVDGKTINRLLQDSKVFLGLGFPYEGPGPLEAAVHGAIFINPKYKNPISKLNDEMLKEKPTLRKLSSQCPYLEDFVGEPYVYTIDIYNVTELRRVLSQIAKRKTFEPYLPKEFTHFGMAERVHAFIEYQDFCSSTTSEWPPLTSRQIYVSNKGESCTDKCKHIGLICEPTYFESINLITTFQSVGIYCNGTRSSGLTHAPSFDPEAKDCFLQEDSLSFSCSGNLDNLQRICPCRDYMQDQRSICRECLL